MCSPVDFSFYSPCYRNTRKREEKEYRLSATDIHNIHTQGKDYVGTRVKLSSMCVFSTSSARATRQRGRHDTIAINDRDVTCTIFKNKHAFL
ncbi:unnamed protein product [Acanthoscelides obtectus]|uniref:Uncharacterized protein n=1 Tax=Acanthoscelides obtectus TaxID=200917 RepID=A0A9P0KZQ3_ACAOB|nr:unnamed protein product [Acanthoscelides obtectus]CAK1649492.1 hypothetical protein AOBTE_LOCUS16274 [Acanthoscelides obtectus]